MSRSSVSATADCRASDCQEQGARIAAAADINPRFQAANVIGNLHDRLFRFDELGRPGVVDFMKINYPWGGSWPVFNVADVALLVGVGLLLLTAWRRGPASDAPDGGRVRTPA